MQLLSQLAGTALVGDVLIHMYYSMLCLITPLACSNFDIQSKQSHDALFSHLT